MPVSLEAVFQMGFNVIDQIIVGLLGAGAVAAVGLSNSIASTTLLLYASASVGAGVMAARAFGRKDLGEVSRIAAAGQALAGGLGLLTALLLVAFSQLLLRLAGADQKLTGSADTYFRLYAVSIAPMILSAVTSAVFRSLNAPRTPLVITSVAVVLNTEKRHHRFSSSARTVVRAAPIHTSRQAIFASAQTVRQDGRRALGRRTRAGGREVAGLPMHCSLG
jgi:Na+-driven multidrug efflux pump